MSENADRRAAEPVWPGPKRLTELLLDTPPGAAYEAGKLSARLRAFVGLSPLLQHATLLGAPKAGTGDVGEHLSAAELGVPPALRPPRLWLRRCCEAALDGDGMVDAERALERIERPDFLEIPEAHQDDWDRAFYPLDDEEMFWKRRGFTPLAPGEAPPMIEPDWVREIESRDALLPLVRRHVEAVVAVAQDLRRVFAAAPAEVAAAFELGRALGEVELPPSAYRVVLDVSPGWRWPLSREQLERVCTDPAGQEVAADGPIDDLPDRLAAAVEAEAGKYSARVLQFQKRRERWRRRHETVGEGKRARPDPLREVFVPLPERRFIGPGPWELRPEFSVLRQIPGLAIGAGLPADAVPAPPDLPAPPRPDARGWLSRAGAESLSAFGRRMRELVRGSFASEKPSAPALVSGPFGVTYNPATGTARRPAGAVVIPQTKRQARLLFQRLCEEDGHLAAAVINDDPSRCGFDVPHGRRVNPDTVKAASSRLDTILVGGSGDSGLGLGLNVSFARGDVRLWDTSANVEQG